ncbi:uncharacterized protein DSM5745_03662 [Aspergillus mulundensis]|uniref:Secreted protein n=1 Tax=Aspergillus mulundensis TaxID=1810919 RepID=A0A3D8SL24_9EURO|nr:hypothetical protein DSM5745_03662 [Aspergillus mulundensis]RDW87020.1 hypothetical protein DSM5745_03662 [Aspergillus mulundensis]
MSPPRIYSAMTIGLGLLSYATAQLKTQPLPSINEAYITIASGDCLNEFASVVSPTNDRSNCVSVGVIEPGSFIYTRATTHSPVRWLAVSQDADGNTRLSFNERGPGLSWRYTVKSSGEGYYGGLFIEADQDYAVFGPDWQVLSDGSVLAPDSDIDDPVQLALVLPVEDETAAVSDL